METARGREGVVKQDGRDFAKVTRWDFRYATDYPQDGHGTFDCETNAVLKGKYLLVVTDEHGREWNIPAIEKSPGQHSDGGRLSVGFEADGAWY